MNGNQSIFIGARMHSSTMANQNETVSFQLTIKCRVNESITNNMIGDPLMLSLSPKVETKNPKSLQVILNGWGPLS